MMSNNFTIKNLIFTNLLLLTTFSVASAQTDVYLRIYNKTFQRMELDLYPFSSESSDQQEVARLIEQVLSNDLWMSGYFKVNIKTDNQDADGQTDGVSENGQALAVLKGTYKVSRNKISIRPNLIDRASGATIIKSKYSEDWNNKRYLLHKVADDIVYRLTGERGIARSKIAYATQNKEGHKEIAIIDYDGESRKLLTQDRSINLSPAWSPDGSKICYTSFKEGMPYLYVMNLRTNSQFRLSDVQGLNSAPAWSPDGKKIAFTMSKDGNAEIYLLDVRSKKLRRLTYNRAIDSSPTWSPANREIAFTSDRSGSPQIYIMDSDGLSIRRLTFEGGYNDSPAWSPLGEKIAYVSRTESGFDIYTIEATGENQMRLTDSSASNENPSWAPNGFSLVFSSTRTGKKELYTMFWDGSEQKRLTHGGINYSPGWSPRHN